MSDQFQVIIVDDPQNLVIEIENQVQPDIEVQISPDPTALVVEVDNGIKGTDGVGVPAGGTYGQILVKNSGTDYDTAWLDGVLVTTVRNNTGATLTKGTLVYINGMLGNRPTVAKALATSDATSAQTYGMIAIDLPNNTDGPVVHSGQARNLNTQGVTEGVQLYLSPTVAGAYTTTKPLAPNHLVYIGICTRAHPTQGTIEITIQNGYELYEIHDVSVSSTPPNGTVLEFSTASDLWVEGAPKVDHPTAVAYAMIFG